MTERKVEIGKICYRGPHVSFIGEEDHGVCGSKYYATVYLTVEEDWKTSRDEMPNLQTLADELADLVSYGDRARSKEQWDAYDKSMEGDQ